MAERDKYFIPDQLGGLLTAEQAISHAVEIYPEAILLMDMPAKRRLHLTYVIHESIRRYVRYLTDERRSLDDFEMNLGSSRTFDPFSRTNLDNADKEDLALLTDVFRDLPEGWGKRLTSGQDRILIQDSKLLGVFLVNTKNNQSGLISVSLVGKNKVPSGTPA